MTKRHPHYASASCSHTAMCSGRKHEEALHSLCSYTSNPLSTLTPEPTEADCELFQRLVGTTISTRQQHILTTPRTTYPAQEQVLAIHWHPQHIPLQHAATRLQHLFPNAKEQLIIPTEHNVLHAWGEFAGVEVDCRDVRMSIKLQLLLHFCTERVVEAHTLQQMLHHTAHYRILQLKTLLQTAADPHHSQWKHRAERALRITKSNPDIITATAHYAAKLLALLKAENNSPATDERRSTLLRDFVEAQRATIGDNNVHQIHTYTKALRDSVKVDFSFDFFYEAQEFIEEAKALGGMVTIPHPEQFWPILLAGYNVDAIEVWNPQSRRHTGFLIDFITEENKRRAQTKGFNQQQEILITMGDDTHFAELLTPHAAPSATNFPRELGVQPWDNNVLQKALQKAHRSRRSVMTEFRQRLRG